jgi:hypothetical protein
MLCLIILTFKHENSFWLVLKCNKNKNEKQKNNYESRIKSRISVEKSEYFSILSFSLFK